MGVLTEHLSPEAIGFVLTLALSLLIGLEREEHGPEEPTTHFGGIRTFPIIGLGGFLLVTGFPGQVLPFATGLAVLGLLLAVSHWGSMAAGDIGLTTEVAALLTFTLGGTAAAGLYWIAVASGVVAVILLQEKRWLESLATSMPTSELRTLARFLVLTAVILPAVPNQSFTRFDLNPFKFWLVVSAVSAVSYASYLLQRWVGGSHGLILSGLLGGAYSSTVTTVALARQSKHHPWRAVAFAGAIIAATGVMYLRLWILVRLFAPPLASRLLVPFLSLGVVGIVVGAILARANGRSTPPDEDERAPVNPLEMSSAFTFAGLFLGVLVVTRLVSSRYGDVGLVVMAAIMGAADVDPFILGLTQVAGSSVGLDLATLAILIAAASNNLMKGLYAVAFGAPRTGRLALGVLVTLGVASIVIDLVL